MAATASLAPESASETLSTTAMMSSQFSEVRFSSVALTVHRLLACGILNGPELAA